MKTILLIEDNADLRKNTAETLEFANYKVLTAENGREGVAIAIEHKPDVIICDILMPVMDGYGVINILQKNPRTQHIPFIFLSAKTERDEIRKGMEYGADDYITKPFNDTELLTAVEQRLKKAAILESKFSGGIQGLKTLVNKIHGKEALDKLISDYEPNMYNKGVTIYSAKSHPAHLFYIQKGTIKEYKTNEDGKQFTTSLYGKGEFFGYAALIEGNKYQESAETIEDSEIVVIPKKEFDVLLNNDKEVLMKFLQLLAGNIEEKKQQLLQLAYSSLRKKVANTLLMIYRKYKTTNDKQVVIDVDRDSLASIAGTAKESFIRTLGDFRDEKIIDIQQGNIIILNEPKLVNMLN